ncbi:DUF1212-domain-containing protein [Mycena sanguinolenta]|uniref:DUF1212-domain-containing protein n=1 Tax=Mycena sanguinolenta TaxID=230812 RepID=A0A8H7CN02_9AGAR|nr:DUF1212-domain-containing protein [Mycena sanguinolenta]
MSVTKGILRAEIQVVATASPKAPPIGIMTGQDSPRGASGSKTPRKVQWIDERLEGSTHALDELGADPNAFENLTTALERHQSASPPPRIHYFPPRRGNTLPPINTDHLPEPQPQLSTASDGDPSAPPSPTRQVPGNYISPHENAGLPGTSDLEHYSHRAASQVVRAHTRKGFFSGFGAARRSKKQKSRDGDARVQSDVEQDLPGAGPMNPPLAGGGLLSTLLTLYNEEAGMNSAPSTPGTEEPPDLPWLTPAASASAKHLPPVEEDPPSTSKSTTISPSPTSSEPSPSPPNNDPTPPHDPLGRMHARTGSQSSLAKLQHILLPPKKPRNSAGALGALIASTANISGVAAPVPSQLAPNLKRPGYHLSRYTVEEEDVPTVPPPKERPRSMPPMSVPGLKWTSTVSSAADTLASKRGWSEKLGDLQHAAFAFGHGGGGGRSGRSTPAGTGTPSSGTDRDEWIDEKWLRDLEQKKEKRRKRKKAEVYITRHVAQIIQRQEFILKLARALMMFGGPSHRLQSQIQSTGRVLDIQVNCMYLPDVVLISFDDSSTGTSNLKFIRQGSSLNLGKLKAVYELYWSVIHDEQSVSEASTTLDALMRKKQEYSWWQLVLTGGMCSTAICSVGFNGSFIDSLIAFPLGALLVGIQLLSIRNELYSNVFEITVATLFSFLSAALASTGFFLLLRDRVELRRPHPPRYLVQGFIVLCGSLEIMSRNIVSGSVRMCYAVVYSLFLGFGLAIGAEAYEKITSQTVVGITDYACSISHDAHGAWYQRTPSLYWAFLTVPMYSLFLSMRNHAPWRSWEMFLIIGISCIGWVTNHFSGLKFKGQSDIIAAVGAFTVGFVANVYARLFSGNAFVIMITGILFQLPSGLGQGGLLTYASETTTGNSSSYLSGFQTALQLISVAIGLTVGLGLALAVVHPIQSRRRAAGVFSL